MIVRDFSAWYHVVFKIDHTNTSVEIYVNGVSQTLTTNANILNSDGCLFTTSEVNIGREPVSGGSMFNGYLANIQFIDGQALDANNFGERISDIWVPKEYTGTYGTNGFHLDFHPDNRVYGGDGKLTKVLDASGENNNDWDAAQ
jgi:hypothetical protein